MNFWLQSSFVVFMLIGAVSAEGFQTFSILPTQIQRLDFGNPFFTSSSATNCEQERTNCINKCTEENMLFYCSSLLTLVSTCTCITPPSISPYILNESLRCKIARLQCLGTCGPNPNFQCQDSGTEISESCSCSDVSTENELIDQNITDSKNNSMPGTFLSAEAISQVNSTTVVDTIDGTDMNNTTNITVSNNDKSNEKDIEESSGSDSVIIYEIENSDASVAFARSTAIVQNSNKTEQVTETTTLNKPVQKNEDDDDSDDEDDEEENKKQSLSTECEKAKANCQAQCKNLEIDFDCQSNGGALSQSCACVSKTKDLSPSPSLSAPKTKSPTPTSTPTPTTSPTLTPTGDTDMHAQNVTAEIPKDDEVADEPLSEVSRNNYILSDKNQVNKVALEPECEQAKKECENTCGNMEIDFDCHSNGGAFSQSCACVSKNKNLSPSPSTPSPKSPTPTPTPTSSAKPPAPTPTPTTPTPTPTPSPSPKMTNNTSIAVAKSAAVVSTDTDMHALNTTLEDIDMHAQNVTLDTAKVDEAADEPLTEIQINNYAMEPECEQAKKECEKTCMDMEIDFDCKKVGINFSKSCACVSENVNVSNVSAISDVLDLQNEP